MGGRLRGAGRLLGARGDGGARDPLAVPVDHPDRKAGGGGWWWHNPADTLDKADPELLADDTRLYVALTLRICTPRLHPDDFVPVADDFVAHLGAHQETAGDHLDLGDALGRALRDTAVELRAAIGATGDDPAAVAAANATLLALSRPLNPVLFTVAGPHEFDPALQLPVLPGLAGVRELASLDPAGARYRFLRTQLVRQRNGIEDALRLAHEAATAFLGPESRSCGLAATRHEIIDDSCKNTTGVPVDNRDKMGDNLVTGLAPAGRWAKALRRSRWLFRPRPHRSATPPESETP